MIDADLVRRKIKLIAEDLPRLVDLARRDRAAYLASDLDEIVTERLLERVIGRMIDINYHLVTGSGGGPPSDYYQSFTALAPLGVLSGEFAQRIASCAGLRNRLVHEYDDIDPQRVHEALTLGVEDFPEYLRLVHEFLIRTCPS